MSPRHDDERSGDAAVATANEATTTTTRDYLSSADMTAAAAAAASAAQMASTTTQQMRVKHGLLPRDYQTVDVEHEAKVNAYIAAHRTWRERVYVLRDFEYWRLRADFYPYIARSDEKDDFFLRGISCHPRLSEFPTCKTVIRDYFVCRDKQPVMQLFNMCAPLKEQFCACINEVFVKNHERGDRKFNAQRDAYFQEQRTKRFNKLLGHVNESLEQKNKLQD